MQTCDAAMLVAVAPEQLCFIWLLSKSCRNAVARFHRINIKLPIYINFRFVDFSVPSDNHAVVGLKTSHLRRKNKRGAWRERATSDKTRSARRLAGCALVGARKSAMLADLDRRHKSKARTPTTTRMRVLYKNSYRLSWYKTLKHTNKNTYEKSKLAHLRIYI